MAYEAPLMHVTKMHGARNDFVLVDARTAPLPDLASFARSVCDRRAGIGADGVLVLQPSAGAQVRMRTFNADGTEAEVCGNGVRCAARWLAEAGEGERVAFETGAGIVRTQVVAREPEYMVRVGLGRPSITALAHVTPESVLVDLGNPHVVIFQTTIDAVDLEALATRFQSMPAFANGTNVHVAQRCGERRLRVRHWERGVGQTQACGTGAVACAAVAIERGDAVSPVEVVVPGGRLAVEWDGKGDAYLTGPAVRVFDAELHGGFGSAR